MATTKDKGDILEQVVAWLHEAPGVVVQRGARLPIVGSRAQRREIDVLLTSSVSGHDVRLAIECKNEEGRIGSPKIDAFRGKLLAVGIPPSMGIYVSAHGYTEGALEAARAAGIKTLVFDGLSADRLSLEVAQAFQSIIVLLPLVEGVNLVNDVKGPLNDISEAFLFYDADGEPAGTVPDFVWQAWLEGNVSADVGTTYLMLDIPEGWHNVLAGQRQTIKAISVTVKIVALVLTLEGEAKQAVLIHADSKDPMKRGVTAAFPPPNGQYQLRTFETEAELNEYLSSQGILHVAHRIRSPRILFSNMMYWPPSQRVADVIAERMLAFQRGEIPDPRPFSLEQLEGTDLSAVWEPITDEYMRAWQEWERRRHGGSG